MTGGDIWNHLGRLKVTIVLPEHLLGITTHRDCTRALRETGNAKSLQDAWRHGPCGSLHASDSRRAGDKQMLVLAMCFKIGIEE